ncbi:acyltransferase family protein [Kibdelosporangium phytohabitans]|uniref:Acyltransferase n=1 Tax=Kibdelosporangium phytohabitans TaxID=860235 RepID=A0A0N9HQB4_9PSEU|nr:acyltransferase [Kibdelosporangium phytohabitans]ALG06904.1 acyltransferase [Kibdelosporangium phytohabitans]MBE1468163.1 fucose 4-O-acetylase-like acetyltransferase [Kibdelosporangium phytohabitans]
MSKRDPFLDVVRVLAILLVVFQHWLVPVLGWNGTELTTGNAYATPGWWALTWVGQVMPLVFFAGGAANLLSLRSHRGRGGSVRDWLSSRVHRLAVPMLPLIGVWLLLPHLLTVLDVPLQPLNIGSAVVGQLLWFMAVYLAAILVTPWLVQAEERYGLRVFAALAGAAVLVDVLRFSGVPMAGFLNAVFVWLAVHQLGFHYAKNPPSMRAAGAMAAAGFGLTALMVAFGPYPLSMIGMPGAPVSNAGPPTACLITLGIGQIGLVLLARPLIRSLVARPAAATVLTWVGARSMSLYLWHMSAMVAVAGVWTIGLGYSTPAPGSVLWFAVLPLWIGSCAAVLYGLLRAFGRFEASAPGPLTLQPPTLQVMLGTAVIAAGTLGIAATGFAPGDGVVPAGAAVWSAIVLSGLLAVRYRLPSVSVVRNA